LPLHAAEPRGGFMPPFIARIGSASARHRPALGDRREDPRVNPRLGSVGYTDGACPCRFMRLSRAAASCRRSSRASARYPARDRPALGDRRQDPRVNPRLGSVG